ncbi:MAG: hypothetical protein ACK531_05215 [Cyanobacteriota bacterium]
MSLDPAARSHRRRLVLALAVPALLALLQRQWLLGRPPHLEGLQMARASAGPASLQARFSRRMALESLKAQSELHPPLPHRWLGEGETPLLALSPGTPVRQPLDLRLAGRDSRGLALPPEAWRWDPRPRLVAVVPVAQGEQLQLQEHDGHWHPISPVWSRIAAIEPLGDGSGVAVVSQEPEGMMRVWRVGLRQRNLARASQGLAPVQALAPDSLEPQPSLFAHLSSNRRGELLVQAGGVSGGEPTASLWPPKGRPQALTLAASGPMRLLPEGGSVVVPGPEGLHLETLPPLPPRRQTLPGRRDLSSFCPQAGRALLLRHWPDYRRSLELIEPGQPPRQLWVGSQGLVASACARGGDRVWAVLMEGVGRPDLSLVVLNRQGRLLRRQPLPDWELEPGSGLHYDPVTDSLVVALRRLEPEASPRNRTAGAEAVRIDATSLQLKPLGRPVRLVGWLPAG